MLGGGGARSRWMLAVSVSMLTASASAAACALVFSPGDYVESSAGPQAPGTGEGGPGSESGGADGPSEGSTAPTGTRILVVGGRRDAIMGEPPSTYFVTETMRAAILASGDLSPWTYDQAPPLAANWTSVGIGITAPDAVLVQSATTVYKATATPSADPSADPRITSEWITLALRGSTPENGQRPWLFDRGLVSAGGLAPSATGNVYFAPFNLGDAGIDPWALQPAKLVKARSEVTLLRYKSLVYAIGGRTSQSSSAPGQPDVEVAALGADGLPTMFQATTPLTNPATTSTFGVMLPTVAAGAGHVFVIGGLLTANSSALSDIAIAATVDETTGKLGPWLALPKLPTTLTGAAAVVANNTLYIFGGAASPAGPLSDAVLSVTIPTAGGAFATEWKRAGTLPGPRSGLAVAVY